MEQQKQYSTLIRWLPGADDKSVDIQIAGKNDFLSINLHSVRLRLASVKPMATETRKKLASCLVVAARGSDAGYWNSSRDLRFTPESIRSIANRGPASKQIPQSVSSFYINTVEICIRTDPQGRTIPLRFLSGENLSQTTNGAVSYCDLEPRTLKELIQWNLTSAPISFPFETVLPPIYATAKPNEPVNTNPILLGEMIAHFTNEAKSDIFDDCSANISVDVAHRNVSGWDHHIDVLFVSKERPSNLLASKSSTLHVCLEDAMENFMNRRWSLAEYGEPSPQLLRNMMQWACTVSRNSSCSLKDVFERGRLHVATAFIDTCFEKMGLVPYQAMVQYNKRAALKRSRNAADAEATADSGVAVATSTYQGGHVMESLSGLYMASSEEGEGQRLISLLDFDSHYPSIILEWNLFYKIRTNSAPLGEGLEVAEEVSHDSTVDTKYFFSMLNKNVLTKRNTDNKAIVPGIKLVINAMYGSFGAGYSTMGDTTLASDITAHGRDLLSRSQVFAKQRGATILMGHTDSMLLLHKNQLETQAICKDVNENFKIVKLRVSQTYDLSWVINKTHHISIKSGHGSEFWRDSIMKAMVSAIERMGLKAIGEPASIVDECLDEIEKSLVFPGLVSTAMPPTIRLFNTAIASILTFGWLYLRNVPVELSLASDMGTRMELPPWLNEFIAILQPMFDREKVKASAWYHYFDRKEAHASTESKSRGKNDGNYRSFLADLWTDNRQRYIPVIRRADKQGFDIPNMNQQNAVDIDTYYWIEKTLRTFNSYVARTVAIGKGDRDYALRILDECLRQFCPRRSSVNETEESGKHNEYYVAAIEACDAFLENHFTEEEKGALPDIETWVELACTEAGSGPSSDLPHPTFDKGLWDRLFKSIEAELPKDIYHQDVIAERIVWHYNVHDQIETRVGLTRAHVETAIQRLSQWGVYKTLCQIQDYVFKKFAFWY